MAKNKNTANPRGLHVSPGIYTSESELTYAVKSLGITTLGVVGETVKGPAFQPMEISNWREFQNVFGGTNPEKFKGSQYPKYELPYIAKSYLTESKQLQVVRVLGLGGYNAGPAWMITASDGTSGGTKQAVAVIRSRGTYKPYVSGASTECVCETSKYDNLTYYVGEKASEASSTDCAKKGYNEKALQIKPYIPMDGSGNWCDGWNYNDGDESWYISQVNHGKFVLEGVVGAFKESELDGDLSTKDGYFKYAVSLNPYDKEYILNVLGTKADDGEAPIFVETLYDVALDQGIAEGTLTEIDKSLTFFDAKYTADYCQHIPINGMVELPQESLTRKYVGGRFLATKESKAEGIKCVAYDYETGKPEIDASGKTVTSGVVVGQIYTVRQYTTLDGKREYHYGYYTKDSINKVTSGKEENYDMINLYGDLLNSGADRNTELGATAVYNNADGLYYKWNANKEGGADVDFVSLDMNDYKSSFRYASTPWIVSNLKGDIKDVQVNKLFRLHTISDGDNANLEIKVSIENIRPDDGTFDVVIRDINDVDGQINPLERFTNCTMVPGDNRYIAYKIGSFDGTYESKSKYVTVEVNETTAAKMSVPCGFLGYPIPQYNGLTLDGSGHDVNFPTIMYNRIYDTEIKNRKQYFGLSSIVGVDVDNFTFKGRKTYINSPKMLSKGFHLDSRMDEEHGGISGITVDGESGYEFECVSINARTQTLSNPPIIGKESEMYGSIFENVNLRKFTLYFYGGFDGWDVYRDQRTNTDAYKKAQYKGFINQQSGEGYAFDNVMDGDVIGLNQPGITSDWYAYLGGIRQFANPASTDINLLATPGIDYVNNRLLVEEAISMVEEERADTLYVVTTPDKPMGAGDFQDEMYTAEDAVYNLEDSEISSNYACTYYPWVKYLDQENNQYIFLPPTKDVVRNMAQTDNETYPWFSAAGTSRGRVDCVRAKKILKLQEEDELYAAGINPIKTFSSEGVLVWGNKTMQDYESQLDRINVRRLLLRVRKLISLSCLGLIFEPNDPTVEQSFRSTVTPILDNIRSNRGLYDYRLEINSTPESRERHELPCILYLKPTSTLEYITIQFVVTPESVSFSDL